MFINQRSKRKEKHGIFLKKKHKSFESTKNIDSIKARMHYEKKMFYQKIHHVLYNVTYVCRFLPIFEEERNKPVLY